MGIAAYNRGSAHIASQVDSESRQAVFFVMDALNAMTKYPDAGTPFSDVMFLQGNGGWWIVPADDPGGFGFWYPDLREAIKRWMVEVVGYEQGRFVAHPRSRS